MTGMDRFGAGSRLPAPTQPMPPSPQSLLCPSHPQGKRRRGFPELLFASHFEILAAVLTLSLTVSLSIPSCLEPHSSHVLGPTWSLSWHRCVPWKTVHAALKPRSGLLNLRSPRLMGAHWLLGCVGGWAGVCSGERGRRHRENRGGGVAGKDVWLGGQNDWPAAHLIIGRPAGSHRFELRPRGSGSGPRGAGCGGLEGSCTEGEGAPGAGGGVAPPPPLSHSSPAPLKTIFQLGDRLAKTGVLP